MVRMEVKERAGTLVLTGSALGKSYFISQLTLKGDVGLYQADAVNLNHRVKNICETRSDQWSHGTFL